MSIKKIVIYCRYSSDMQRPDSCTDQEREVRAWLARRGVDLTGVEVVVIYDEAESGTKSTRDGFRRLREMVARGEVAILAVDTQSRLTRAENAHAFITDLVYAGGRFVAAAENIDTATGAWELPVRVMEMHNGLEISSLRHMVHRGQAGGVLDDGSAGDFCYGYESYYIDADWAEQLARRGPKPKKGLRICEAEAQWVRQVFAWFVAGCSIGWIARELTRLKVPKGGRATTAGWHPQQVRRMLANAKYVGDWVWGKTATRRDSQGRKKQVAVPPGEEVTRARPKLRIIEQDVWDKAAARLAELGETFGCKPGQRRRGPRPNPADVYPRSPLGGVLVCGKCGAKMWQHRSNTRRYYSCAGTKKGLCDVTARVPADRAERSLTEFLLGTLRGWPVWVQDLYRLTCDAIRSAAARVPAERERDAGRAVELGRQIDNLVNALAESGLSSPTVVSRLRDLEKEQAEIDSRLAGYAEVDPAKVTFPDDGWVSATLGEWAGRAAGCDGPRSLLRLALASAAAEPVVAVGKKRGFVRLRFRVDAWGVLAAAVGDSLPVAVGRLPPKPTQEGGEGPEFTLDLGEPTVMDTWAPQIAAWRTAGVTWEEIVRRTDLDLNRVYVAWKRYTRAAGDDPRAV